MSHKILNYSKSGNVSREYPAARGKVVCLVGCVGLRVFVLCSCCSSVSVCTVLCFLECFGLWLC